MKKCSKYKVLSTPSDDNSSNFQTFYAQSNDTKKQSAALKQIFNTNCFKTPSKHYFPFIRDIGFFLDKTYYMSSSNDTLNTLTGNLAFHNTYSDIHDYVKTLGFNVQELNCFFDGGNIIVDSKNKFLILGSTSIAKASQHAKETISAIATKHNFSLIFAQKSPSLPKESVDTDFFHLDNFLHLLPNGELVIQTTNILDNQSIQDLKSAYGSKIVSIHPDFASDDDPSITSFKFKPKNNTLLNIVIDKRSKTIVATEQDMFKDKFETFFKQRGFHNFIYVPREYRAGPHCITMDIPIISPSD